MKCFTFRVRCNPKYHLNKYVIKINTSYNYTNDNICSFIRQRYSGISVIRISGSKTKEVILKLTKRDLPNPRVATRRKFNKFNNNELIDEGILIWFPGPMSYTGEDMAEFHVHGSKAVVDAMYTSISSVDDCRLAEPGEFTKIAFQNGKINLLKAESISDLISSETEIQRQQAIKIMSGKNFDKFNSIRNRLLKILSSVGPKRFS